MLGASLCMQEVPMAKVFGIHQLELRNDADAAEFERFVRDEYSALPELAGWQASIAKGERGENVGKYLGFFNKMTFSLF